MRFMNKEIVFTDAEKRDFISTFNGNDVKIKGDDVPSDLMLQKIARTHYMEILNPVDIENEKYLSIADLDSLVEGIQSNWPKRYSNRTIDGLKIAINNQLNIPLFKKSLTVKEIDDIREGLIKKISAQEGNKKVSSLCRKALSNPYLLDMPTFENWMALLIKNCDEDIFADLSNIFATINEEKNIPEKIVNALVKKTNEDQKAIKFRNRKEYYQSGVRSLKSILTVLPDCYDISNSLPSLKKFISVLEESELPDVENQIEYFLLNLFKPGKVVFSLDNDYSSQNIISNIYDLCINYLTKAEVKKQFIEHMFSHENCSVLAITKGKEILLDKSRKYSSEIQLYVVQKLSELYENKKNLDAAYVTSIRETIIDYVSTKTDDESIQKETLELFLKSVPETEKTEIVEILVKKNPDNVSNLQIAHDLIIDSDSSTPNTKINTLQSIFNNYDKSSGAEKNSKKQFLLKVITGDYENEVRNYAFDLCFKILKAEDLEQFITMLWDKCYESSSIFENLTEKWKEGIKDFQIKLILNSDDYNEKNTTFLKFISYIEKIIPEKLLTIYEDILNQDNNSTCNISKLHETIQKDESIPEKIKLNSIKIMCNGYKKSNDSVKGNIKSLLSDVLLVDDNAQVKNEISVEYYKNTLSSDEQKEFVEFVYNKCNQDGNKFRALPKTFRDDILQANQNVIDHDQKKQMVLNLFESYTSGKHSHELEDDIINYLLTESNPTEDRRVLLIRILEKV